MSDITSYHEVEVGSEKSFGLVFAAVFALFGVWPFVFSSGSPRWWCLIVAAIFLALALVRPSLLAPFNRLWFKLGMLLGRIVAPLVMTLVFFLAVTPTALIARLFKKDFLRIGRENTKTDSFWIARHHDPEHPSSMKNQF